MYFAQYNAQMFKNPFHVFSFLNSLALPGARGKWIGNYMLGLSLAAELHCWFTCTLVTQK